jgi:TfuA protein
VTPLAVFLGPSLERSIATSMLDATFLPPIQRGSIDNVVAELAPTAIGIIDGQFFQGLSISPKEILRALDAGIRVFGASSMGALRAVELAPFGMTGVGEIYRLYAEGILDSDDEVAMVYNGDTLAPLSVPLVNMRLALRAAVGQGLATADFAELVIDAASALYYPDRTYNHVFAALNVRPAEPLAQFLSCHDAKRDDAIQMLVEMRKYITARRPPA